MTALGATDGQTAIKMLINKEATTDPKPYPTAGVATDGQIAAALKAVENSGVSYICLLYTSTQGEKGDTYYLCPIPAKFRLAGTDFLAREKKSM